MKALFFPYTIVIVINKSALAKLLAVAVIAFLWTLVLKT